MNQSESLSDIERWVEDRLAGVAPAILGSLSLRRSPCIRENCRACLSGEQHPSYVLYGRAKGAFIKLSPEPLKALNDVLIEAAVDLGVENGTKLRVDTTVVQTDVHHPTDNTLLWDTVRVVTRLVGRLAKALECRRFKGFHDRRRSARRRMQEIQRMTTRQRHDQQTGKYRELITID